MAKENKSKYALLGVLKQTPGSGYDIKKFCDYSIGFFWNENYGHIYPMLQKMEKEELIKKEIITTEGKPARNVFSITDKGNKELEEWVNQPVEKTPVRSELLLKIFLSKDSPVDNIAEKIRTVMEASEKNLKEYLKLEKMFAEKNIKVDEKNRLLWLSTIRYGKYSEEAQFKWCEETLSMLETIKDL